MALAKALVAQTVHTLSSPHTEQACTELACGISTEAIYGCPVSFLVFECVMVCPCDCMPPLALRAPRRGFRLCVGTVPVDVWSAPLGATVGSGRGRGPVGGQIFPVCPRRGAGWVARCSLYAAACRTVAVAPLTPWMSRRDIKIDIAIFRAHRAAGARTETSGESDRDQRAKLSSKGHTREELYGVRPFLRARQRSRREDASIARTSRTSRTSWTQKRLSAMASSHSHFFSSHS
jgi:hypothetical protein